MGTIASIRCAEHVDLDTAHRAMSAAHLSLHNDDSRFSHYRIDSDISRWSAGLTVSPDAVAEIDQVLRVCADLRADSNGAFTVINPSSGRLDTAGYVKGYAIAKASRAMRSAGVQDFLINVGGDAPASGSPHDDRGWRLAIANPVSGFGVVEVVELRDQAIATSGTAQRGAHVWGPAAHSLLSFTVVGSDIAFADAYATTGFAMGRAGGPWVSGHAGYSWLAIAADGTVSRDRALVCVE